MKSPKFKVGDIVVSKVRFQTPQYHYNAGVIMIVKKVLSYWCSCEIPCDNKEKLVCVYKGSLWHLPKEREKEANKLLMQHAAMKL